MVDFEANNPQPSVQSLHKAKWSTLDEIDALTLASSFLEET